MAAMALCVRGGRLALLGLCAALLFACASQEEQALSALHYFQKGNAAFQAEDFRRAIGHYEMALEFDADAPDLHYNLGLARYRIGAYEQAVRAYQRAVELDPEFAQAHLNLALTYDKLYNAAAAHLHYNRFRAIADGTKAEASEQSGQRARTAGAATAQARPGTPPGTGANGGAIASGATAGSGGMRVTAPGSPAAGPQTALPPGMRAANATAPGQPRGIRPSAVQGMPQGALQGAGQTTSDESPNPFQGNDKWWTQDPATPIR